MPPNRFFLDLDMQKGDWIDLVGAEGRHAKLVMRREKNDWIELVNGRGVLAHAQVTEQIKMGIRAQISKVLQLKPRSFAFDLIQVMPKWESLCWIVEKATELGISNISIALTLSKKALITSQRLLRLRAITISALKQSGALYLPKLKLIAEEDLAEPNPEHFNCFADVLGQQIAASIFETLERKSGCTLRIGSEGGFSSRQRDLMLQAGMQSFKLHSNILRSETAAICGVILLQNHLANGCS